MQDTNNNKSTIRRQLRETLAHLTASTRHAKSVAACSLIIGSAEFQAARVVMVYLSTPTEVDTTNIAIKAWKTDKTVVVPKVSWDQRRMLPIEISSLHNDMSLTGPGIREPMSGNPIPTNLIDLVIVPGLGFTETGYRIGRGMGFYDRFLAQPDFIGVSCGLAFEEQIVPNLPVLDHDVPLGMLATDRGIRRFSTNVIAKK